MTILDTKQVRTADAEKYTANSPYPVSNPALDPSALLIWIDLDEKR